MIDEDLVETSDAEELAQLEKERDDLEVSSSPLRGRQDHSPRKRIKLFHEGEKISSRSGPHQSSSPLPGRQSIRSTPIKQGESAPDSRRVTFHQLEQENPVTPVSSARTQSSSTVPVVGSPVSSPLFSSRSPTRTPPVREFSLKNILGDEKMPAEVWSSPPLNSPDPLRLQSPSQGAAIGVAMSPVGSPFLDSQLDLEMIFQSFDDTIQVSTTPPDTPHSAYRSSSPKESISSQDLARLPLESSSPLIPLFQNDAQSPDKTDDKLLLFSPTKPASRDPSSSTPIMDIQQTALQLTESTQSIPATEKPHSTPSRGLSEVEPGSRRPRSPVAPALRLVDPPQQLPVPPDDQAMLLQAAAEVEQLGRYSFRKRNAAQLAPYTADLIQYKRALKSNPDAIVKMKQIERHIQQQQQHRHLEDRYEEEHDYTNPLDAADDAEWEERELRRKRRVEKEREKEEEQRRLSNLPAILQELLTTDDEEKEMDAASKEARKVLRAKERERRLKDKEEEERRRRERRPKPYPLSKPERSPKHKTTEPESGRHGSSPFPSFHSLAPKDRSGGRPELPNDAGIVHDYFHNDDFEMFDFGDAEPGVVGDPVSSQVLSFPSSSRTLDDNPSNDIHPDGKDGAQRHSHVLDDLDLDSKRRRILGRVMPWSLVGELARETPETKKPGEQVNSHIRDLEDDGPLPPGKTRVRRGANLGDIKAIKGDSESEEERIDPPSSSSSSSDESDSDSDSVEILQTYRPRPPRFKQEPEVIEVDLTDSDGDEDIQFFVQNTHPVRKQRHKTKLRDQSIINYMLPKVYTTGGRNRDTRHKHPSRYKLDIMTTGSHGRERQSLLSFDGRKKKAKRRHELAGSPIVAGDGTTALKTSLTRTTSRSAIFTGDSRQLGGVNQVHTVQDGRQVSGREKGRLRKARAKRNGIYNFTSGENSRITNGRRADAAFFTVDLEDEGFHDALAPMSASRPRFEPAPPKKRKDYEKTHSTSTVFEQRPHNAQSTPVYPQALDARENNIKHITCDLDIKRLHSGRSFGQSTYIRKGWLHELVNIEYATVENNTEPPATILCRFELGPTMGIENLCLALPRLLDALFESATDILDSDSDILSEEWKPGFRVVSLIISWYLRNSGDSEKTMLRETISKEVQRIANLIDKHSVSFIEKPILSLCWFLVELSTRTSTPLPTAYHGLSLSLRVTSKVLMQLLLRLGIHKISELLQGDGILDESSPIQYATELWVCLIHVLLGTPKEGVPKSKSHPFWTVFMDAFPTVHDRDSSRSFKASEDVWLTIFTICTLSQFSVHGMVTAEPRLPAFWDLVAYGLKTICLTENEDHLRLQSPVLRKRDHYVALVVARCGHLRHAWNWRLDEGSAMFNQLSEIFRSRNFANLRHEEDCLPKFFKHADWNLLSVHDSKDTAFSGFLKLILQADRDEVNNGRKSAKLKKLLSLAVPLRSLSFTSSQPPHGRDLSMYYNRLSAIALALSLDASDHDERINKARNYLAFSTADTRTRHAVLCGLERLAVLMVKRDIGLSALLDWVEEVGKSLDAELKEVASKKPSDSGEGLLVAPAVKLVKHLFLSISGIATTYLDVSRFPDPHLLGKLKSILGSPTMKSDALKNEFALLLDKVFTARSKALPRTARPFTPEEESEESQNYFDGFDDIDFSAIDDIPSAAQTSDISEKDRMLRQHVDPKLKWVIYHHLRPYLSNPPSPSISVKAYSNECDKWLRLWLCFNDLHQSQDNKWVGCINLLDNILRPGNEDPGKDNDNDDPWSYRVNLSIMFQLLQLDPMAYLTYMNRALQVGCCALVSDTLSLESQYISYLLSIDCLRHPLFAGCGPHLPPRDPVSADYQFSAEEFADLRLPLIGVIFRNIERSLNYDDATQVESKMTYIDFCHKMFSWMRRVRSLLMQKADEEADKVVKYTQFCGKVLQAFQEYPLLRSQTRLEFFSGWARTLTIPQ